MRINEKYQQKIDELLKQKQKEINALHKDSKKIQI